MLHELFYLNNPSSKSRRHWLTLLMAIPALILFAANDKTVSGEAIFYDDGNHNKFECLDLALQKARIDALSKEFGTIVSQDVVHSSSLSDKAEEERFFSLSSFNVRGEWISDLSEPEYEISLDDKFNYVVKCKIKGKARPISNLAVDFNVSMLNLPYKEAKTSDFTNGQDAFLWVESPSSDLYICVCLLDQSGTLLRMFPYRDGKGVDASKIKRGYDYILFDPERNKDPKSMAQYGYADGFQMTAPDHVELNTLYVIGSPNPFNAGPWEYNPEYGMDTMTFDAFNSWVTKLMRTDPEMGRKQINIRISPTKTNTETIRM